MKFWTATIVLLVTALVLLPLIMRVCNGREHATAARRPQFFQAGNTLLLAWMVPVTTRRAAKGEPLPDEVRFVLELRYGVLAQQGEVEELPDLAPVWWTARLGSEQPFVGCGCSAT